MPTPLSGPVIIELYSCHTDPWSERRWQVDALVVQFVAGVGAAGERDFEAYASLVPDKAGSSPARQRWLVEVGKLRRWVKERMAWMDAELAKF